MEIKYLAIVLALVFLMATPLAFAQNNTTGTQAQVKEKSIEHLVAVGRGPVFQLSDSLLDPSTVQLSRISIGAIKLVATDDSETIAKVGILYMSGDEEETRYVIRGVEVSEEGLVTAKLYDGKGNEVGSISGSPKARENKEIFEADITLDGTSYKAFYLIPATRALTAAEKVKVMAKIRQEGATGTDEELELTWAAKYANTDLRAREALKRLCTATPERAEKCANIVKNANAIAEAVRNRVAANVANALTPEKAKDFLEKLPQEVKTQAQEKITERLKERINNAKAVRGGQE